MGRKSKPYRFETTWRIENDHFLGALFLWVCTEVGGARDHLSVDLVCLCGQRFVAFGVQVVILIHLLQFRVGVIRDGLLLELVNIDGICLSTNSSLSSRGNRPRPRAGPSAAGSAPNWATRRNRPTSNGNRSAPYRYRPASNGNRSTPYGHWSAAAAAASFHGIISLSVSFSISLSIGLIKTLAVLGIIITTINLHIRQTQGFRHHNHSWLNVCQVNFIYIALLTIQIVLKQLYSIK